MKTNEKELEPPKAAVVTLPGDLEAWILCDVSALYEIVRLLPFDDGQARKRMLDVARNVARHIAKNLANLAEGSGR